MSAQYWIEEVRKAKGEITKEDIRRIRVLLGITGDDGLLNPVQVQYQILEKLLHPKLYSTLLHFNTLGYFPVSISFLDVTKIPSTRMCLRLSKLNRESYWQVVDSLIEYEGLDLNIDLFPRIKVLCICCLS